MNKRTDIKVSFSEELDQKEVVCLTCNKHLGHITYAPSFTNWNILEIYPQCKKCFEEV